MNVVFYNNQSDKRVLNKNLTPVITISNILFLENADIKNVYVILEYFETYKNANYFYIAELNRYYYITDVEILNGNRIKIYGDVDVLMSFSAQILACEGILSRSTNTGNVLISDQLQPARCDNLITNLAFSGCEFTTDITTGQNCFLLTTFGGTVYD